MKMRVVLAAFVVVGIGAWIAAPGFSEEEPKEGPTPAAQMAEFQKKWMELAMPTENHAWAHFMVGDWTGDVSYWMGPGSPEEKSQGKVKNKLLMDGRYVRSIWSGDFGGMPFKGELTFGYNNATKQYQSLWIDNMSTWMGMDEGTREGDVVTLTGTHVGVAGSYKNRTVTTKVSNDEYRMESFSTYEGQPEFKSMVIVHKRK